MKIRNKINLSFLAVSILLLVITSITAIYFSSGAVYKQTSAYLVSVNRTKADHIRTFLQSQKETGLMLAAASVFRDLLKEPVTSTQYVIIKAKVDDREKRNLEIDKNIFEAFITNKNGIVVASSNPLSVGEDKSNETYFAEGKKSAYIRDVYKDTVLGRLTYAVSAPITDNNGAVLGVSVTLYGTAQLNVIVKSNGDLGKTEEDFIINKDKLFLTPSIFLGDSVILKQKNDTKNASNCFSDKEVNYVNKNGYNGFRSFVGSNGILNAKDYRNVDVIDTHMYIPETGWCLITKIDATDMNSANDSLLAILSVVFVISILVFMILSYFISRFISKPIAELMVFTNKVKRGDLSAHMANAGQDEVGDLSRSFVEMTKSMIGSRVEIDQKVKDQTAQILKAEVKLENQQKAILNVLDDVKAEKTKAEKSSEELRKFQLAVAGASDHIVITDPEGMIIYANKAVTAITGFSIKEVLGKKAGAAELWGGQMSKEFYVDFWNIVKNKKKSYSGVFHNKRKSGEKYEADATVTPILDKKGEVAFFLGIERDVTKDVEIDMVKTEFVSLAAHQLRTPLSIINWYAEILRNGDDGKLNKNQSSNLNEIYTASKRMVELVNSLLNVSRLELGTFEIRSEPIKLCSIVHSVAAEMKVVLLDKKQKLNVICPAVDPELNADPKLLRIIIQNLLSNASKYSPERGVITVSAIYNPNNLKSTYIIKVSDNGFGIPERQRGKIFTKLFRADNVRSLSTEGTGLGLYIVRSILTESGGSIDFTSVEGKGTTFTVVMPKSGMQQKTGTRTIEN